MLTPKELEELCLQPESTILDFKQSFYEFGKSDDDKGTAALVKDILAMVNTVRSQASYIIFGIRQVPGQAPAFIGVNEFVDDAVLQDKIKSKLIPRPEFHFYSLSVKEVTVAVLEFPVRKYTTPISSTIKLKGIEPGKVYHRLGSSNTEALGNEVIRIYEWLKSLPDVENESKKNAELSQLLIQAATLTLPYPRPSQRFLALLKNTASKNYPNSAGGN